MPFIEVNHAKYSPDLYRKTKLTPSSYLPCARLPSRPFPDTNSFNAYKNSTIATVIICIVQGRILRQRDKGTCPVSYISKWQS